MATKFEFNKLRRNILRTKRELPVVLANLTQNHFAESFTKGALDANKWKEVNRRIAGTREFKYPKTKGLSRRTSPILVRTGNLRRKVQRSIVNAQWQQIRLVVDLPYASAHNEGTDNIEARPFMIQTEKLAKIQEAKIKTTMDKIWK